MDNDRIISVNITQSTADDLLVVIQELIEQFNEKKGK